MAIVNRGRVIRAAKASEATSIEPATTRGGAFALAFGGRSGFGRVVPSAVVDAHREAAAVLERARERAAEQARQDAEAKLAAGFLALRIREERRAETDLERTIEVAKLLAERIVGAALEVDPTRVVQLAKTALTEARGARRVVIEANPLDADALRTHLDQVGLPSGSVEIRPEPSLSRGGLVLHTDLGTLDARLHPQLDRLAAALRSALR